MSFVLHDLAPAQQSFAEALRLGLSAQPKATPPRFLYDRRGSELFDEITRAPEYYPTRTELAILAASAGEIGAALGPGVVLLEFGAGSPGKALTLLAGLERPAAYAPIDVSLAALEASAGAVQAAYPALPVAAIRADYGQPFAPPPLPPGPRVGFFPGSTIGNLRPEEARAFLRLWAPRLGPGGAMLVGVDVRKPDAVVRPAYEDSAGVTGRFIRNLLVRANGELGADFDPDAFAVRVEYDEAGGRLSIHLESLREQAAAVAGETFHFAPGERVHVEDSWKYAPEAFQALARDAGYAPRRMWRDADGLFSVHLIALP